MLPVEPPLAWWPVVSVRSPLFTPLLLLLLLTLRLSPRSPRRRDGS